MTKMTIISKQTIIIQTNKISQRSTKTLDRFKSVECINFAIDVIIPSLNLADIYTEIKDLSMKKTIDKAHTRNKICQLAFVSHSNNSFKNKNIYLQTIHL